MNLFNVADLRKVRDTERYAEQPSEAGETLPYRVRSRRHPASGQSAPLANRLASRDRRSAPQTED